MTNKKQPTSPEFSYQIADDKRSATLSVKNNNQEIELKVADEVSAEALITILGEIRGQMLEPIPDTLEGLQPVTAFNPRWYIYPDSTNTYATFWIRHPAFGWSIFGFPRHEAANISKWLRKVIQVASTRDTQSPAASSFGGDSFLLTTEGLGFYYYGKGENRIGPNPFEQVEYDSDRAAGIVAGSITERRLEQAICSRLRNDQPAIMKYLFRPSGALGPFSTKIKMAYLMGILSDDAYKDLDNLKGIRNDFAHDLELDSFDAQSILARCNNFIIVDRHIGPIPNPNDPPNFNKASPYFGIPDYEVKLSEPRFRYIMTAQLISSLLGQQSDNENATLPFI